MVPIMNAINTRPNLPTIIDVEASKFGQGGFPIEIGFVRSDGFSYCCLIKPQPNWTHWDLKAEQVHGISRQILQEKGKSAQEVAHSLNEYLSGCQVYSDAWGQDFAWLSNLFEEAGTMMDFKIEPLESILSDAQKLVWHQTRKRVEQMLGLRRHRASADARVIQMTYHWSDGTLPYQSYPMEIGAA